MYRTFIVLIGPSDNIYDDFDESKNLHVFSIFMSRRLNNFPDDWADFSSHSLWWVMTLREGHKRPLFSEQWNLFWASLETDNFVSVMMIIVGE